MPRPKSKVEKDYDTQETSERCSGDLRLRRHGFRIKSRPPHGPAMWERKNDDGQWVEFTEVRAHKLADLNEKAVEVAG